MRSKVRIAAAALTIIVVFIAWSISHTSERFQVIGYSGANEAGQPYLNKDGLPEKNTSKTPENIYAASDAEEKTKAETHLDTSLKEEAVQHKEGQAGKAAAGTDETVQQVTQNEKQEAGQTNVLIPESVSQKAEAIANKEVDVQDFAKAAAVILGKLSLSEIKFIFDTANSDFWVTTPVEEIEKVRNIIFSKLSSSDLATLKALGKKYGRSMTILEPNIDVAATKAKQVAKQAIK